jgi:hypothetical protein
MNVRLAISDSRAISSSASVDSLWGPDISASSLPYSPVLWSGFSKTEDIASLQILFSGMCNRQASQIHILKMLQNFITSPAEALP